MVCFEKKRKKKAPFNTILTLIISIAFPMKKRKERKMPKKWPLFEFRKHDKNATTVKYGTYGDIILCGSYVISVRVIYRILQGYSFYGGYLSISKYP